MTREEVEQCRPHREQQEIDAANESGRRPIVFVHGLWLLAGSWDPWRARFEERGYATLAPGWPDDPETIAEARQRPEVFADKSLGQITSRYADIVRALTRPPIVIGHSFGGLITQKLVGDGLGAGAVAIDPAPLRGVLRVPFSTLKSAFPVLRNPLNRRRAIALTFGQFRYAFANAVPEPEARALYDSYSVPGAGRPLFQAALANFNPRSEARVDTKNDHRGPLLIISGEHDHTVPWQVAHAAYKRYRHSNASTEIIPISGRGHSLTIDGGWPEVAEVALKFLAGHGLGPESTPPV